MKNQKRLKKWTALLTAVLMILAALPVSMASAPDWAELTIRVHWADAEGNDANTQASPLYTVEGIFCAMIPSDILQTQYLTLEIEHPRYPGRDYFIRTDPMTEEWYPAGLIPGLAADAGAC